MEEECDIVSYAKELMTKANSEEFNSGEYIGKSQGIIILRDGTSLKIKSHFLMFQSAWAIFSQAQIEREETKYDMLKEINNGIISNGVFTVDVSDIAFLIQRQKESPTPVDDD